MTMSDETRRLLAGIMDILIPANPSRNIPAGGLADVVDLVVAQENDGLDLLLKAAARALEGGEPLSPETVRGLEMAHPESFAALLRATYMGYYSRADIRACLGLKEAPVHPDGYEVAPEPSAFLEELTAPVRARGKVYRNA
ncbi:MULTISPECIES: hypothetical protein [Alphaproteobacteria]|uniref:hypothetical protein n=1 Tax=Alphaproteobacteria TaxID=28211 RepID=UPI003A9557F1